MIKLESEKLTNSTKYQYYEYDMTDGYKLSTTYNEPTIINGVTYTPINGAFEISDTATTDAGNRVCDIISKLDDTDRDVLHTFSMICSLKGWMG